MTLTFTTILRLAKMWLLSLAAYRPLIDCLKFKAFRRHGKIFLFVIQIEIEVVAVIGVVDIGSVYACNPEV